jgi:hypothetical protein
MRAQNILMQVVGISLRSESGQTNLIIMYSYGQEVCNVSKEMRTEEENVVNLRRKWYQHRGLGKETESRRKKMPSERYKSPS